jgi:hypothetical protein
MFTEPHLERQVYFASALNHWLIRPRTEMGLMPSGTTICTTPCTVVTGEHQLYGDFGKFEQLLKL